MLWHVKRVVQKQHYVAMTFYAGCYAILAKYHFFVDFITFQRVQEEVDL